MLDDYYSSLKGAEKLPFSVSSASLSIKDPRAAASASQGILRQEFLKDVVVHLMIVTHITYPSPSLDIFLFL